MNQIINIEVEGKIICSEEFINVNKKKTKTYSLVFNGGVYKLLKVRKGLKILKGYEGLFNVELKLIVSENKTIYVPFVISSFMPGVAL